MSQTIEDPQTEFCVVRTMQPEDLEAVVRIDAGASGRLRPRYFELMLQRALQFAGLQVSLVAESEGEIAGYLIGSLYYGEYGIIEPSASIDAIAVSAHHRRKHIAHALLRQFRANVGAIGVTRIRTEVDWDDFDLLHFFQSEAFAPSKRLCLESLIK